MADQHPDPRRTPGAPGGSVVSAPTSAERDVRRPRHLLDPENLQRSHQRSQGSKESLSRVQRWVMSVLAVTTILHLAAGTALLGITADEDRLDARVGLNVIAAVIGIMAVAIGLSIHGRSVLSWNLLLGLLPGLIGAWVTFA